jgi:hypothetical protein
MPNVLIREVPADDLDRIRFEASQQGTSLQTYLRNAVHAQASYLRRQDALARIADDLSDRPAVPEEDRKAVLDAIEQAHQERAEELGARPTP